MQWSGCPLLNPLPLQNFERGFPLQNKVIQAWVNGKFMLNQIKSIQWIIKVEKIVAK